MPRRPLIGLTLDAEPAGGWSKYAWYALRQNYFEAVAAAGGLAVALPHEPALSGDYLDRLDGLIVTGGAFDVDPALYGDAGRHETVALKPGRTVAELALLRDAMARGMVVLGICGGQQLLAVAQGGTLFQHIPDAVPGALAHEQDFPHDRTAHAVRIVENTLLHRIVGASVIQVNTSHHQAVDRPGASVINAVAPDGVVEGVEVVGQKFCLGVQWHPEYFAQAADRAIFAAFVAASL